MLARRRSASTSFAVAAREEPIEARLALGRHAELVGELEQLLRSNRCASGSGGSS